MAIDLERNVSYGEFEHNLRFGNGEVELVLPTGHGPRIARYASLGGPNVFAEISARSQRVDTSFGSPWHIYGGHRLWYAPEHAIDSYYPDNDDVTVTLGTSSVTLTQQVEPHTGLEKAITVHLYERGSRVGVQHCLTNRGSVARELAPWALSAMAPGGTGIYPQSRFVPHPQALAPARPLVLWPFTRMNDPRWTWGDRFICLAQDPGRPEPQKFGCYNDCGYMAYALGRQLFIKCHLPVAARHADFGCNAQSFVNELFLELETLGPLLRLLPGQSVRHREDWFLLDDVDLELREPALQRGVSRALDQVIAQLSEHADAAELVAVLARKQ